MSYIFNKITNQWTYKMIRPKKFDDMGFTIILPYHYGILLTIKCINGPSLFKFEIIKL